MEQPQFWRDLRAEFRSVPNGDDMYADVHFGLVAGDASSCGYFKALAKRGGVALGTAPHEAFRAWLTAVADYLKRTLHPSLRRARVQKEALIAIGEDQYARPDADGGLILEADTWIEHVCDASAELCTALETESFAQQRVRVNTAAQSAATTATVATPAPKATADVKNARRLFPKRAAWLKQEMANHDHMTPHRLRVLDGPDKKTTARILRGERVLPHVLDKLAKALSVLRVQIPDD